MPCASCGSTGMNADFIQAPQFGMIADADMLLGQVCKLQQRSGQILTNADQARDRTCRGRYVQVPSCMHFI
jgi:hypothetical protein